MPLIFQLRGWSLWGTDTTETQLQEVHTEGKRCAGFRAAEAPNVSECVCAVTCHGASEAGSAVQEQWA